MVCSNLSSLADRLTHSSSPKGRPLSMLTRTRPNSFALSGAFTRSVQSTGRSTGQGDELALIASSPCVLAHRPLQMFVGLHREALEPSLIQMTVPDGPVRDPPTHRMRVCQPTEEGRHLASASGQTAKCQWLDKTQ